MPNCRFAALPLSFALIGYMLVVGARSAHGEPMQVGFLWHMHQPNYYPYEPITATDANGRFSFSVVDVHNQRFGPYTTWSYDAVQAGTALPHLGASVSFSGSLIENLNVLAAAGVNGGMWTNWSAGYQQGVGLTTSLGHPRLDLVAFGYHHPLMPLLNEADIRMQIRLHRHVYAETWAGGATYARGMFPPETAFSTRMIPALVAEGIEWVLVDNIHFDRACVGYPYTAESCILPPNPADQINPDPAGAGGAWVQLQNLWAPSRVSVPFGYQPHHAEHIDPETGAATRMVVVPAARYEGNEDGRGGYGAFLYQDVMDAYTGYNTDDDHPMLVVLHHDGDNFGGGSEAYYHHNFQNMVNWALGAADYDVTTIQDYLERFPPAVDDVIHVENGAWAGADCGDPEFKKWLGDPNGSGWSPDRNSWAVLTAAKNRVFTAEAIAPATDMQAVLDGTGSATARAWHYLLVAEASDHWYWDGSSEPWDSNVTRGCNQAGVHADAVIGSGPDTVAPTVFLPQREPYNPGGFEWAATPEPSDFEVWTYVYDVSGVSSVTLKWRVDADGVNPLGTVENETYAGGAGVGSWNSVAMSSGAAPTLPANILAPTYRATRYGAMIIGQEDVLIDYYVEALDGAGNLQKSDIQHVYVGQAEVVPSTNVTVTPEPLQAGGTAMIVYDPAGGPLAGAGQVFLHYGFNDWDPVVSPDPAMTWDENVSVWEITVALPSSAGQLDFAFNNGAATWDNNNGQDWHHPMEGSVVPTPDWMMDGQLDAAATRAAENGAMTLHYGVRGGFLYVAAADAGEGNDHFVFVAAPPGPMQTAPWAKAGQVAGWAAFLADENNNDFVSWFDTAATNAAATGPNGGVLEGTIHLAEAFGNIPETVCLAFGAYQDNDGGALVSALQVPASVDGNGHLEPNEHVCLSTILAGDVNEDWQVAADDVGPFVQVLLGLDTAPRHMAAADIDASGVANGGDIPAFVALLMP